VWLCVTVALCVAVCAAVCVAVCVELCRVGWRRDACACVASGAVCSAWQQHGWLPCRVPLCHAPHARRVSHTPRRRTMRTCGSSRASCSGTSSLQARQAGAAVHVLQRAGKAVGGPARHHVASRLTLHPVFTRHTSHTSHAPHRQPGGAAHPAQLGQGAHQLCQGVMCETSSVRQMCDGK
jgi:hypothetical protein